MAQADAADDVHEEVAPKLALAFTLCARLCHDLAGTAGALAGALDMAETEPDALALARDCAGELVARLRLLRVAWGSDGDAEEPGSLVAGLPGADRLGVDLSGLRAGPAVPPRLLANLLLLAARSLPRGGTIGLSAREAGLVMEIDGPRAAWPAALAECLASPERLWAAAVGPGEVGVAVTCLLAQGAGLPLAPDGPTRLRIGGPVAPPP